MAIVLEAGYGQRDNPNTLVSLGGVLGVPFIGRQADINTHHVSTTRRQLLGNNSRRIAALLVASKANDDTVPVYLADSSDATVILSPGDSFQIDYNLPWTGSVYGISTGADEVINVTEISVP